MESKEFNTIIKRIESITKKIQEVIVYNPDEFDDLTIREIKRRLEIARSLYGEMDIILTTELYHIIGMGELNLLQQISLFDSIKELSSLRPYLKPLCCYNLPKTPDVPEYTEYKCKVTGVNLKKDILEE